MPTLVQTHWAPLQQYPKPSLHWRVDQYHNKPNMDAGENTPQPHIATQKIFLQYNKHLGKRPQQAKVVIPSQGHCRARGALTLLFLEQLRAQGCHHKFRCFTCAGTEPGKDQKKLTPAERQTACAASVLCQDFCASLKRIPARAQDWLLHEAGGMMDPCHWGQVALTCKCRPKPSPQLGY